MYDDFIKKQVRKFEFCRYFLMSAAIILSFIGCSDEVKPNESILQNNPWLQTFAINYYDFQGVNYNIDLNHVTFNMRSKVSNTKYLDSLDIIAREKGWTATRLGVGKGKYQKKSEISEAANHIDEVIVSVAESGIITVDYKPVYE